MITTEYGKTTAKKYVNDKFERYISVIYCGVVGGISDDELMDDEKWCEALYFFMTEPEELVKMTRKERMEVIRHLRLQTNRLLKIVAPRSGYYPESTLEKPTPKSKSAICKMLAQKLSD